MNLRNEIENELKKSLSPELAEHHTDIIGGLIEKWLREKQEFIYSVRQSETQGDTINIILNHLINSNEIDFSKYGEATNE